MYWRKYPSWFVFRIKLFGHGLRRIAARAWRAKDYSGKLAEEADHWSEGEKGHTWLDSGVVNDLVTLTISGDKDIYWLMHFKRKHVAQKLGKALNLGCGSGGLERNALAIGLAESFDSFDVSDRAIEECRKQGDSPGTVNYICMDINKITLQPDTYDAAFAVNILHHLVDLEHVLDEVKKSLKPGGLFVTHEYVGPARFQWTDEQLKAVNEALGALPKRYRINRRKGGVKRRVFKPLLDETNPDSPFEAARSNEIVKLIEERFDTVERVDLGGALLHPLLEAIVANFDESSESDRIMLKNLWEHERDLMKKGLLGSDFVYAVYRRPGEN